MVQQGYFATTGAMHYRSQKANFTIYPTDAPVVYAYALNTSSSTRYYVSWNGATEVRNWRIYILAAPVRIQSSKTSYCTEGGLRDDVRRGELPPMEHRRSTGYGKGIRSSSRVVETFVPSEKRAAMREEGGRPDAQGYIFGPAVAGIPHLKRSRMYRASSSSSSSAVPKGTAEPR